MRFEQQHNISEAFRLVCPLPYAASGQLLGYLHCHLSQKAWHSQGFVAYYIQTWHFCEQRSGVCLWPRLFFLIRMGCKYYICQHMAV